MSKLKLCLIALGLLGGGNSVIAQTDVTATYIQNPGFEEEYVRFLDINTDRGVEKPNGWSVEWYQSAKDQNGMTYVATEMNQDDQVWSAPSGKAYLGRIRWQNATLYLRQTMRDLRPGKYTLNFKAIAYTNGGGTMSVSVAGQTKSVNVGSTNPSSWNDYSIDFTIADGQKYATIEVKAERTKDLFKYGIDEFTLSYDGSTYYPSIISKAQTLYNDNKDWATDADALAQAITDNSGKADVADINAAIVALETAMATFREANTVDMTSRIVNPTFDSNISGWTCTGSDGTFKFQNSSQVNITGGFMESWRKGWTGTWNHKSFDASQTITGLPKGEYTIKAAIMAQMQGGKEAFSSSLTTYKNKKHGGPYYIDDEHGVWLYGTSGSTTSTCWANSENSTLISGVGAEYRTATVDVQDGTLTIGFKGVGSINGGTELGTYANWIACDNWTLSYFGFDPATLLSDLAALKSEAEALLANAAYENVTGSERTALAAAKGVTPEEKKTALETAISNLQAAMNTFKAAKTSYDEFVAERTYATEKFEVTDVASPTSADDAVRLTNTLNVAEYNYVKDKYTVAIKVGSEWPTNNISSNKGQHWSGNSTTTYDDKWSSSAWTGSKTLQLTLPAGRYILKASGRKLTNAQLALKVSVEDSELGSVSNFPNTNVGKGIATDGSANFSDDAAYANGNNGYGWQWRFVPFTIDADDTAVNISVEASGDGGAWISICDYELFAIPNVATATMEYEQVLDEAQNTPATYPAVTGEELTDLNAKISADKGETVESITAVTASLRNAMATLIDANSAYVSFNDAKSLTVIETLPYASSEKYTAMVTAASVESASSKADAEAKTADILRTRRDYVESNGIAEGVEGAVDYTSSMPVTVAGDAMPSISYAELRVNSGQGATDSEGNNTTYYFDTNNTFYGSTKLTAHLTQTVTGLPTGKYLLTVQARGASNLKSLTLTAGSESMNLNVQANTGVYGNMWDDYSLVTTVDKSGELLVKISGVTNSKSSWFGFNNFRLVKIANLDQITLEEDKDNSITAGLADVTLKRTIVANVWNTLVLPFHMTNDEVLSVFGADAQVAAFSNTDGENVNFDTTTEGIKANVPVLLKAAAGTEYAFNGYTLVKGTPKFEGTQYDFVGNYNAKYNLADGEYMLSGSKFWKNDGAKNYHVKGFRAYLSPKTPEAAAKSLNLVIDGTTTGLKLNTVTGEVEGESYNLAGQRVADSYKGLVIKNGKKVIRR